MREPGISGKLIAVEGLDGSGKSTQIHLLHQWLLGLGCKVFFSEWNSSVIVKDATRKGKRKHLLTPTTFSLIHATDFADRYERQILPMLRAGYIVLCDRYIYTSFARDGVRGCNPGWLRRLYGFAKNPDVTLYFKLPLKTALGRILEGRMKLQYFEASLSISGRAFRSSSVWLWISMKRWPKSSASTSSTPRGPFPHSRRPFAASYRTISISHNSSRG
jgi:dTMP kinase